MDWILTVIGSVVGSVILSVVGNLLTDKFKSWQEKRSLVNKRKTASELEKEIKYITRFYENRPALELHITKEKLRLISDAITGLVFFIIGVPSFPIGISHMLIRNTSNPEFDIAYSFISGAIFWVAGLLLLMAFGKRVRNLVSIIEKVEKFNEFKSETEKRIVELSGQQHG